MDEKFKPPQKARSSSLSSKEERRARRERIEILEKLEELKELDSAEKLSSLKGGRYVESAKRRERIGDLYVRIGSGVMASFYFGLAIDNYYTAKKFKKAEECCEKLGKASSKKDIPCDHYGRFYYENERYKESIERFKKVIKDGEGKYLDYYYLVLSQYRFMKRNEERKRSRKNRKNTNTKTEIVKNLRECSNPEMHIYLSAGIDKKKVKEINVTINEIKSELQETAKSNMI